MADHSGSLDEAQIIARLREIFASSDSRIEIGIGDDAAVVLGATRQVLTTDMAVAGVHFRTDWSTAFEIGRKVTAANTADILAMGAVPDYLLVAVALTGSETMAWITELARGIKYEADLAGAFVVGGDISRANQIVISISAFGSTNNPITRSGARPGDGIFLSSLTGWSAAGLALLESNSEINSRAAERALQEFKSPTIDYGFNASGANSLCDISDALSIQAKQLADSSKVSLSFDLEKIKSNEEFAELQSLSLELKVDIWEWIFAGGEDHVLLATGSDLPGIRIGQVLAGSGIQNLPAGVETVAWQHFK
jgi:thiamine-monophosphate kinase